MGLISRLLDSFFGSCQSPSLPTKEVSTTNQNTEAVDIRASYIPEEGSYDSTLGTYVRDSQQGYLYIICIRLGERYKIGVTSNLQRRESELKQKHGRHIKLVFSKCFQKPFRVEQELLAQLSDKRRYLTEPEILALDIKEVNLLVRQIQNTPDVEYADLPYLYWRDNLVRRYTPSESGS
ncbi:GIY-YIG nuclease family protein [Vibrio parahaemolyticus]|nr:GIY-YIG nuclease family protein [Vibrio parahaemolyticus]MCR9657489.1 GIY-YIG nuclease family protein [Vibrio parahaemolyticus]